MAKPLEQRGWPLGPDVTSFLLQLLSPADRKSLRLLCRALRDSVDRQVWKLELGTSCPPSSSSLRRWPNLRHLAVLKCADADQTSESPPGNNGSRLDRETIAVLTAGGFTQLRHLSCWGSQWDQMVVDAPALARACQQAWPQLEELQCWHCRFEGATLHDTGAELEGAALHDTGASTSAATGRLQQARRVLRCLQRVDLQECRLTPEVVRFMANTHCPQLHHFGLWIRQPQLHAKKEALFVLTDELIAVLAAARWPALKGMNLGCVGASPFQTGPLRARWPDATIWCAR